MILDFFIRKNLHTSAKIYFLVNVKILNFLQALSSLVFLNFYKVLMAYSKKCMRSISIKYLKVGFMGVHNSKPFRFYFTIFWEDDTRRYCNFKKTYIVNFLQEIERLHYCNFWSLKWTICIEARFIEYPMLFVKAHFKLRSIGKQCWLLQQNRW
jgi:hypothetical protein